MNNINTMKYWDYRFRSNWEEMSGNEQTEFFAKIAINLLPGWLKEKIKNNKLSICDFGCATGQAVNYLHNFFQTEVSGADISKVAIEKALEVYPQYRFWQTDIVNDYNYNCNMKYDIGYISNVLEHITNPWEAAKNIIKYLAEYLVILIPFRETMIIDEHCNKFDTDNIPLNINNFQLIYASYTDCSEIADTLYADKQILLVYTVVDENCHNSNLKEIVHSFEQALNKKKDILEAELNKARSDGLKIDALNNNYNEKIKDLEIEIVNLKSEYENRILYLNQEITQKDDMIKQNNLLMQNLNNLIDESNQALISHVEEVNSLKSICNGLKKDLDNKDVELKQLNDANEEQTAEIEYAKRQELYMRDMIYRLQIENEKLMNTISWKVTKPLRIIGHFTKQVMEMINDHKVFFTTVKNSKIYKKYLKRHIPQKARDRIMNKYFSTPETLKTLNNSNQEIDVLDKLRKFENGLKESDQLILVFSGVKYIDCEGQRNIRLIHEARKLGKKIIFAYWRWNTEENIELEEENIVKIPIDILVSKQIYIFENLFRNIKDKSLLVEFPHPSVTKIIEIANSFEWKTIYDVIDDWEQFSYCGQAGWYKKEVEKRVANIVDINIATAHILKEKIKKDIILDKPYYVITNGVDPKRMKKSEKLAEYNFCRGKLQIGYWGHLTEAWFDWKMLKNLANKHNEWTFHIIGYGEPDNLNLPANIKLYGKKKPEELPKYAAYWDVSIIPFVNNELTKGVNPIKVFEYLQLRLPVVASDMPEIKSYPYVTLAVGEVEFEKAIINSANTVMDDNLVQTFIDKNTWKNKCMELLKAIDNIQKI